MFTDFRGDLLTYKATRSCGSFKRDSDTSRDFLLSLLNCSLALLRCATKWWLGVGFAGCKIIRNWSRMCRTLISRENSNEDCFRYRTEKVLPYDNWSGSCYGSKRDLADINGESNYTMWFSDLTNTRKEKVRVIINTLVQLISSNHVVRNLPLFEQVLVWCFIVVYQSYEILSDSD